MDDYFQEDLHTKCAKLIALIESGRVDFDTNNTAIQMLGLLKEHLSTGNDAFKEIEGLGKLRCENGTFPSPNWYIAEILNEKNRRCIGVGFRCYSEDDNPESKKQGVYSKGGDVSVFDDFSTEGQKYLLPQHVFKTLDAKPDLQGALLHELQHALDDLKKELNYGIKDWSWVQYYCSGNETNARFHVALRQYLDLLPKDIMMYPLLFSQVGFVFVRDLITEKTFSIEEASKCDYRDYLNDGIDKAVARGGYSLPEARNLHFQKIQNRIRDRVANVLLETKERKRKEMLEMLSAKFSDVIARWRNNMPNLRMYIRHELTPKTPQLANAKPSTEFIDEIIKHALAKQPK